MFGIFFTSIGVWNVLELVSKVYGRCLEGDCKSCSLSCLRIVVLLLRAVTERFKVKNLLKCQRFTKGTCWRKLRGIKQMKCKVLIEIFKFIWIFEYIWVFEYIQIFFPQYEYIHIRIRMKIGRTNIFVFVFGPEKNIRSSLLQILTAKVGIPHFFSFFLFRI